MGHCSTPSPRSPASGRSCWPSTLPGQRLVFARNPRYFRKDADGARCRISIASSSRSSPTRTRELLRLDAGQIDMTDDPRSGRRTTRRSSARPTRGASKLLDLGVAVDADSLWFNLKPGAFAGDPRAALAAARRAAAGDLAGGRSPGVRRHGLPRRRRCRSSARSRRPTRSGMHADLPQTPHDPARREDAARVDRPDRIATATACSKMPPTGRRASRCSRRKGRRRSSAARGDPRRAEEDRPHRRRRAARRQRAGRSVPSAASRTTRSTSA